MYELCIWAPQLGEVTSHEKNFIKIIYHSVACPKVALASPHCCCAIWISVWTKFMRWCADVCVLFLLSHSRSIKSHFALTQTQTTTVLDTTDWNMSFCTWTCARKIFLRSQEIGLVLGIFSCVIYFSIARTSRSYLTVFERINMLFSQHIQVPTSHATKSH